MSLTLLLRSSTAIKGFECISEAAPSLFRGGKHSLAARTGGKDFDQTAGAKLFKQPARFRWEAIHVSLGEDDRLKTGMSEWNLVVGEGNTQVSERLPILYLHAQPAHHARSA